MKIDTYTKHEKKALITYAKLKLDEQENMANSSALRALLTLAIEFLNTSSEVSSLNRNGKL